MLLDISFSISWNDLIYCLGSCFFFILMPQMISFAVCSPCSSTNMTIIIMNFRLLSSVFAKHRTATSATKI
ncbi:PRELI domain containing protein 3B [Fusarium oxysporum f. sp. albedinis]|nr:PRELI domain containing protein 3B [Fusarium oxysporum f. sp. albedinis]